jgi:NitT/TauT family transport system substrate-binding protein
MAVCAAVMMCTAALTASAAEPEKFNLTVQPGSVINVLIEVATKEGFWKANNLDPQFIVAQNGPAAIQALASGSVDVAANAPENFLPLVAKGIELQAFCGQNLQVFSLFASKAFDAGHAAYPDLVRRLKEKKIGVTAPGSASYYTTVYLLKAAGLKPDDVQSVSYSSVGGATAAFETSQIDAGIINQPSVFILLHDHKGQELLDLTKTGEPASISGIPQIAMWARTPWIKSHPTIIAGIRRAMAQADVFIHDPKNLAVAKEIIGTELPKGYDDATITKYVEENLSNIDSTFPLSAMAAWVKFDVEVGALAKPLDAESLLTPGTPATHDDIKHLAGD